MKQQYKYIILLLFVFSCLLAQGQPTTFYYYQGEKFYLEIDYTRISIVSEGEISLDVIENRVIIPDFNIRNQQKSFTTQNIISLDKQKTEIFTTEIDFLNKIDTEEYFSIIL